MEAVIDPRRHLRFEACVNARELVFRHSEKAKRIIGPEIRLGSERETLKIREVAEIVGMDAMRSELQAHCRD